YAFGNCLVDAPATCNLPWGGSLAHGASTTAYLTAAVSAGSSCQSESRSCYNGSLSGSYTNAACARGCFLPWSGEIASGQTVTAYSASSVAWNASCSTVAQTRTCNDGVLSGSYTHQSCAPATPLNCTRPWGGTVNHGSSITAYAASSVPYGSSCQSQT